MTWRILVSAPYFQPVIADFQSEFDDYGIELIVPPVAERLSEPELLKLVGDIDGVIAGDDQFTARVLEKAAPRLKVLSKWGTGIDSFDRDACARHGVSIRNTLDAFTEPVADSVLGYVLCFARRLPAMDAQMKSAHWDKIPGRALNECTMGIVGMGRIGKAVARRALAFGMTVLGTDIVDVDLDGLDWPSVTMVGLSELLTGSDFVSINCDLNPTSLRLMDAARLELMRDSAVLINLARGPIVCERSLVAALRAGAIGGAALDVFEKEPLPDTSELRAFDNVMLAPHNSNSSPRAWDRVHRSTVSNLFAVLEEKTP